MAESTNLVLAFFDSETLADGSAESLRAWAKTNRRLQLEAIGVLVKDESGNVKTHKLGPREAKKGLGIGSVLGIVAAIASGGVTLIEGVAAGAVGGGAIGALFHKGLGMSDEDLEEIGMRLDAGHAAVGVLVPANQAPAVAKELESLGGDLTVHAISQDDVREAAAAAPVMPS